MGTNNLAETSARQKLLPAVEVMLFRFMMGSWAANSMGCKMILV